MNLALFFTRSVSLQIWLDAGIFDREKLIYEIHLSHGSFEKIFWFTYGPNDKLLADDLKSKGLLHNNIVVVPMPKLFNSKLGRMVYSFLIPFLHFQKIKNADILKTNQMDGSWAAVLSKILYHKFLLIRTGYTFTIALHEKKVHPVVQLMARVVEHFAYYYADVVTLSSVKQRDYIVHQYKVCNKPVEVLHNYIDTELFKPQNVARLPDHIIFVGRLTKEKNLRNLIAAISKTSFTLDIYGSGEMQGELEQFAKIQGAKVNFKGAVANKDLPGILNRYQYYVLVSYFEGMPKTLLEAMSCGLICIGTDVEGINEVIIDGVNGYLATHTSAESIMAAIEKAKRESTDVVRARARLQIEKNFSLMSYFQKECCIFEALTE